LSVILESELSADHLISDLVLKHCRRLQSIQAASTTSGPRPFDDLRLAELYRSNSASLVYVYTRSHRGALLAALSHCSQLQTVAPDFELLEDTAPAEFKAVQSVFSRCTRMCLISITVRDRPLRDLGCLLDSAKGLRRLVVVVVVERLSLLPLQICR
jgi:hypothetical protein